MERFLIVQRTPSIGHAAVRMAAALRTDNIDALVTILTARKFVKDERMCTQAGP